MVDWNASVNEDFLKQTKLGSQASPDKNQIKDSSYPDLEDLKDCLKTALRDTKRRISDVQETEFVERYINYLAWLGRCCLSASSTINHN